MRCITTKKSGRKGPLFHPAFKAVRINDDSQLFHVSRYIHLNPVSAGIIPKEKINKYQWSSYNCYMNNDNDTFVDKSEIMQFFPKNSAYIDFIHEHADYQQELQKIKTLLHRPGL